MQMDNYEGRIFTRPSNCVLNFFLYHTCILTMQIKNDFIQYIDIIKLILKIALSKYIFIIVVSVSSIFSNKKKKNIKFNSMIFAFLI